MVDVAMARVTVHLASLPSQPADGTDGAADAARRLKEPVPPEQGAPIEELLSTVFDVAAPKSFNAAGPGYLAYIPGGGLFDAAVADLVADSVNRYTGVCAAAPALVQLETNVVRWLCGFVGYGAGSGGFLTTGGSLANFSALVTARRERLPADFLRGTLYASDQVHHSVRKAALLAGFPPENVRSIPADAAFRLPSDALAEAVRRDRAAGFSPFCVVASAGTTNTGAVDGFPALADVCAREGLWLHVDAAYGGFFLLTERGRRAMAGVERADSVTLDPHKSLFLPYGTGSLVVRDGAALRRAHAVGAEYLPGMQTDPDFVDYCEISPELTRPFRGLRVWLPIKRHGLGVFRRALDEKLDLAAWATEELRTIDGVEIVAEPQLSLVAFRLAKPGADLEALNARNRALVARVNGRNRVHLSGALLPDGRYVARICVLSFRTHQDRMEMALEDVRSAAAELRG